MPRRELMPTSNTPVPVHSVPEQPPASPAVLKANDMGGNVAAIFSEAVRTADALQLSPTTVSRLEEMPALAHLNVGHFISFDNTMVYVDSLRNDDEYVKDVAVNYARAIHMRNPGLETVQSQLLVLDTDKPASVFMARNPAAKVWRWIFRVGERH